MYLLLIIIFLLFLAYYFFIYSHTQIFGYFPNGVKSERKIIALSFDDGPNPPDTENLLNILAKHEVRATFFTPAKNIEKFPELAKKIIAAGHVIGNHSYSHSFSNHFRTLSFDQEIVQAQKTIKNIIGLEPALYRPPWLFKHSFLLKNLKRHQITPVSGFFCSNWEIWHASAQRIYRDTLKVVAPGRIIIFHDGFDTKGGRRQGSIGAIDLLIPELKRQGYEFLSVDELLRVPAYKNL